MSKKYAIRKVKDDETIRWDSRNYFIVRGGELYMLYDWRAVERDEVYARIFQTPTTPADFGLILQKRCELVYHEPYEGKDCFGNDCKYDGWYSPDNDEHIRDVLDYMAINPRDIKGFIMGTREFKNYYE